MKYYNLKTADCEGLAYKSAHRSLLIQRIPDKFKKTVRRELWELSENSSGISLTFLTDTSDLHVEWTLKNNFRMNHMSEVGIKGLDLYEYKNNCWYYRTSGLPEGRDNRSFLFKNLVIKPRLFRIYFPLYDSITKFRLGYSEKCFFKIKKREKKPIVFYGTSITQGGCVSRPGLAYTNKISRDLNRECINLGFSGNGHMESSIGTILSKIKSKLIVIECMANVNSKIIRDKTLPLIRIIRKNNQLIKIPIIFIQQIMTQLESKINDEIIQKNLELEKEIVRAQKSGLKNLYLMKSDSFINPMNESTVDGIHFNDIGSMNYSKFFMKQIENCKILYQT